MVARSFTEHHKFFERAMKFGSAFAVGQVVLDHDGRSRGFDWRLVSEAAARNKLRRPRWGWEFENLRGAPEELAAITRFAGGFTPETACLIAYARPNERHVVAFLLPRHDEILRMLKERRELDEAADAVESGTDQPARGGRL